MTAKLIPIIDSPMEAADRAVRDDIYAALVRIDARIVVLEHKLDRKGVVVTTEQLAKMEHRRECVKNGLPMYEEHEHEQLIEDLFLSFGNQLAKLQHEIDLKFAEAIAELFAEAIAELKEDGVSHS